MDSQYIFENISVYNKIEVDCFQNLLLSYLDLFHADTNYLKICWPWKFEYRYAETNKKEYLALSQNESISLQRIFDIYHNMGRQVYFEVNTDRISILLKHLKEYYAVFVCVDEYYIPYHYRHIFHEQHGLHTLLITNIDMEQRVIQCISSIPEFKGNIPFDDFEKALYSTEIQEWFVYFEFSQFIAHQRTYQEMIKKEITLAKKQDGIIYTKDIIAYLRENYGNVSAVEYLCEGTWGWKIAAKGELLIEFMEKELQLYNNQSEIISDIADINSSWIKGYKLLYKFACSKKDIFLKRALEYIEKANEKEQHLQDLFWENKSIMFNHDIARRGTKNES